MAPTTTAMARLPSVEAVQSELEQLRRYSGISIARVRERAPMICGLPCTADELRRRRLDPSDSHLAADAVIRCGASRLVRRSDLARILADTLNFDGYAHYLEGRRTTLRSLLGLSEYQFDRVEREAYTELAGHLVAATRSPCDDKSSTSDGTEESLFRSDLDGVERLARLLLHLVAETRANRREGVVDAIGELLPAQKAVMGSEAWSERSLRVLLYASMLKGSGALALNPILLMKLVEGAGFGRIKRLASDEALIVVSQRRNMLIASPDPVFLERLRADLLVVAQRLLDREPYPSAVSSLPKPPEPTPIVIQIETDERSIVFRRRFADERPDSKPE